MQWRSASNSGAKNSRLRNAADFAEACDRRQAFGWRLLMAGAGALRRGVGLIDATTAGRKRAQAGCQRADAAGADMPLATISKFEGGHFVAILATASTGDLADREGKTESDKYWDQNKYHGFSFLPLSTRQTGERFFKKGGREALSTGPARDWACVRVWLT
jgi:hypothetical protein